MFRYGSLSPQGRNWTEGKREKGREGKGEGEEEEEEERERTEKGRKKVCPYFLENNVGNVNFHGVSRNTAPAAPAPHRPPK